MTFADKVTSIRIVLIPVFISLLIYSGHNPKLKYIAVGVFILAVLTDFFDGLIARIKNEKSELGQVIDPLADKLLMFSAFIALYLLNFNMPLIIVLLVISKDVVILLGLIILVILKIDTKITPTISGKLTTFFQMLTVIFVLLQLKYSSVIWNVTVGFTISSGIGYLIRGSKLLNEKV